MGFSRQEYWSGLPFPPPGDLPNPGIEPTSLHLLHWQAGPLLLANLGSPWDGRVHSAAFKLGNQQGPTVLAQGTLLNVMWQPGWGGGDLEENGYTYLYG